MDMIIMLVTTIWKQVVNIILAPQNVFWEQVKQGFQRAGFKTKDPFKGTETEKDIVKRLFLFLDSKQKTPLRGRKR